MRTAKIGEKEKEGERKRGREGGELQCNDEAKEAGALAP
jgi:hypothetical protein